MTESADSTGGAGVTWADVDAYFSGSDCQNCHPPTGGLASTLLDHFSLLHGTGTCSTNGGKIVEVPDPDVDNESGSKELSCLWLAVTKQEGSAMFGATFGDALTNLIGAWIDGGAPGP